MATNEQHTRKEIIDKRLAESGWNINDSTQVVLEYDIVVDTTLAPEAATPYAGHQYSDYVLLGKDGKPLAVVEILAVGVVVATICRRAYVNNNAVEVI